MNFGRKNFMWQKSKRRKKNWILWLTVIYWKFMNWNNVKSLRFLDNRQNCFHCFDGHSVGVGLVLVTWSTLLLNILFPNWILFTEWKFHMYLTYSHNVPPQIFVIFFNKLVIKQIFYKFCICYVVEKRLK